MKRVIYFIMLICFMMGLASCGDEKAPSFDQEKLIEITEMPVGLSEGYKVYKLHICVYNDGRVLIYADDFSYWYSDEEVPWLEAQISQEEIESVKKRIIDYDALNLSENVGNRDLKEGTLKGFTIYANGQQKTSKGLSPSNTKFLRVYDFVYELVREECFGYCAQIDNLQYTGYINRYDVGPRLHDGKDNSVISTDMIQDFVIVPASEVEAASETDAETDADASDMYGIAIMLNEEGTAAIYEATNYNSSEPMVFFLYNDNALYDIITINERIEDGTIYLNKVYDKASVDEAVAELEECLGTWRSFKAEEEEQEE